MREQHPLDDLFARGLRDAEATPSDAVWEGIVQERDRTHLAFLQLRRRWGWLTLILLMGGAAGYLGINPSAEKHVEVQRTGSAALALPASNTSLGATLTVAEHASSGKLVPVGMKPSAPSTATGPMPASSATTSQPTDDASAMGHGSSVASPDRRLRPRDPSPRTPSTSTLTLPSGVDRTRTSTDKQIGFAVTEGSTPETTSGTRMAAVSTSRSPIATAYDRKDRSVSQGLEVGNIDLLSTRISRLDPELLRPEPRIAPPPTFIGPRQAWWVAVTAGQYRETRSWHGGDAQLVKALQGTEMPHRTTNFGVLAGLEGRKGWGISTGIEYGAARIDFQHFDQFRTTRDSLVTHVITFNSIVLDSYVDTVSTSTEQRRTVAAVNRYTTLRVPLEGSWHRAWRRWHLGLRGGVALEFNTMRSGVTLMSGAGGTRSVDVSTAEKRTATLVSGGLAVDVGYVLTERLGLWASPGYAAGLFSLSPTDGSPYAVPERLGVRIRLAYTLRPDR